MQEADGVRIPEVLVPFMGGITFLPFVRDSKPMDKSSAAGKDNKEKAGASTGAAAEAPKKEKAAAAAAPKPVVAAVVAPVAAAPKPVVAACAAPVAKPAAALPTPPAVKEDKSKVNFCCFPLRVF